MKKQHAKVGFINEIDGIFIPILAAQTAQTDKFILSNVAYRRPAYETGVVPHKKNLFEKLTFFFSILNHTVTLLLPTYLYTMCYFLSNCFVIIYHSKIVYVIDFDKFSNLTQFRILLSIMEC